MSAFKHVHIEDVMIKDPVVVLDTQNFSYAQELFVSKRIFYLPVVTKNKELRGVLTQKYVYKMRSPRKIIDSDMERAYDQIKDGDSFYEKRTLDGYILSSVMFKQPFTMNADQLVSEAILHFSQKNLGCIPIVEKNKRICGVLTNKEIMDFLAGAIINSNIFVGE